MSKEYQNCQVCILDSNVPGVLFDEEGICNQCREYESLNHNFSGDSHREAALKSILDEIKTAGQNQEYDCVVGVSGGMDSTYLLYKAKQFGLKPLAVHFDNGWNTEQAVSNIKKAVSKLDVDLYTYVVDWEEFKDLQLSFLKASVPDAEIPTDIGIKSVIYRVAAENKIRYYLYGGSNSRTEGKIPKEWTYMDGKYIKSVQKKYGNCKLKSFPNLTILNMLYYTYLKRIKVIRLLEYIEYDFDKVLETLQKELDWEYYGGKHFESVYTKFFQTYYLPVKFNIDKRKVHYSALIRSGKYTREEAQQKIESKAYDETTIQADKEYIYKKFGISESEFDRILNLPKKSFYDFPTYYSFTQKIQSIINLAKKVGLWPELA